MVKCRQTTVKASPLPVVYRIGTRHDGAKVSRRCSVLSTERGADQEQENHSGKGAVRSDHSRVSTGSTERSKRIIFPHLMRLHHGILRYRNVAESPTSVAASISTKDDRRFVFVPAGYSVQNDRSLHDILKALGLHGLPPLVIVTAATDGAVEETADNANFTSTISSDKKPALDKSVSDLDLTEEEERELLREKTHEILESTAEFCSATGAWLLPHRPRRANGAAEILCDVVSTLHQKNKPAVVLGMIGLDQQDQVDGLTELITSHMHPIGSKIDDVACLNYDVNVRDNTPCPELTHLLLFQRRKEMRDFREQLLSKTPDVFMAFGSTTPYAKRCLFATLVEKSPVALITHTSPEIDHMSWMLRHVDREMRKIAVGVCDLPQKGNETFAVSSDPVDYVTLPLPQLAELQEADPELAAFLPVWPAAHHSERVVLADPRRVNGPRFQTQLLRAINAAFYIPEFLPGALKESCILLTSIRSASHQKKVVTESYHLAMVLATLATIVTSVIYAKIYGKDAAPSWNNLNPRQIATFLVTIAGPMLIVYLKKRYDQHSQQWSILQREAAQLESITFQFRTLPRTFGQQDSTLHGVQEPLDAFIHRVREIYTRASPFLEDRTLEDAARPEGTSSEAPETDSEPTDYLDIEAPPLPTERSPLLLSDPSTSLKGLVLIESTRKWKKARCTDSFERRNFNERGNVLDDPIATELCDDDQPRGGSLLLTTKDYIELRILAVRQQKRDELETIEKRSKIIELIIKLVLGSSSLLALLSEQWIIPIVLGVSAAFVASQDFRKYRARLEQGEVMIQKLDELLSWWDSLDIEEKILERNEDRLVQLAESILVKEISYTY